MRFDQTFIAIRQRTIFEILDLSLHVIRDYFQPLGLCLLIGMLPWVVVDTYLVHWMLSDYDYQGLYYWIMFLLVVSQAQVGTLFMTHYLGMAMFEGRPSVWSTVKQVCRAGLFLGWIHFGLRMVLPTLLFCLMLNEYDFNSTITASSLFIPGAVFVGLVVRAFRPYVSEILLLEKTPVRTKSDQVINFAKRSNFLHGASGGDFVGKGMYVGMVAVGLGFSCYSLFSLTDNVLSLRSNLEMSFQPYYFLVSLWLVAGFCAVVRFLCYIDLRIRQEGWAVELRMRAEANRLLGVG